MNCSICGLAIDIQIGGWSEGHNAEPVNSGRCCSDCNAMVVIPRRLTQAMGGPSEEETGAVSRVSSDEGDTG